ncbi:MAG TPA: 16S rRNA (guanine(966)-N(2))-methyltransferase RsmD [Vicinamibacterales bacterium]|nr:16S rRNA (guanine(966)-N(2))-methyltransferase RsmD [Vicinamibacterales bacterium]
MRVIAGRYKGRRLEAPAWPGLRPTADKLRETLFDVLRDAVVGTTMLDAYAGTGAVGIEALSRGASHVTFIDVDRRALDLIKRNLQRCGIAAGYAIIRADLGDPPARLPGAPFALVFLDPPYQQDSLAAVQAVGGWLAEGGVLVLEHSRRSGAPDRAGDLVRTRTIVSGDSALSFYRREVNGTPGSGSAPGGRQDT